jgi:hypothetical protein
MPRSPPAARGRGNIEGTPARACASTRGYSSSTDSFDLRDFRARCFPCLPSLPASSLDGKEGVDGSSPSEGFHRKACKRPPLPILPLSAMKDARVCGQVLGTGSEQVAPSVLIPSTDTPSARLPGVSNPPDAAVPQPEVAAIRLSGVDRRMDARPARAEPEPPPSTVAPLQVDQQLMPAAT